MGRVAPVQRPDGQRVDAKRVVGRDPEPRRGGVGQSERVEEGAEEEDGVVRGAVSYVGGWASVRGILGGGMGNDEEGEGVTF